MTSDLAQMIPKHCGLRFDQQMNISSLLDISLSFARDAGFEYGSIPSVQEDTVILESGHQPNFFPPYSGVWKKVFLLHQFREMLAENGTHGIALFGFADQNATTASFLYKNQVPALNKKGTQKIGFTVKGLDKWKCFDRIEKPPRPEIWEEEMLRLEHVYSGTPSENLEIIEMMWRSYERADSFSDLNAYIFSRISREILGLDVFFFRYSDIQQNRLFSGECTHILKNLDSYNAVYNTILRNADLDLRPVVTGEIPFWYHCDCGGKASLVMDPFGVCRATCPPSAKKNMNWILVPISVCLIRFLKT